MPTVPVTPLAIELETLLSQDPVPLARAAILISRVEMPHLPADRVLDRLEALGARAADRLAGRATESIRTRLRALNAFLYDEEGFEGEEAPYGDVRGHLLPGVLERRRGIPISLALVYLSVAHRAGLEAFGVAFPGHFLLRVPNDAGDEGDRTLIVDPLRRGRELDGAALGALLARHAGPAAALDVAMLRPCTSRQMVVRMLGNLKRLYVGMRSFPHARAVTDLLIAVAGERPEDLRDRGLLAYHLDDYPSALGDLEAYLRLPSEGREDNDERTQNLGARQRAPPAGRGPQLTTARDGPAAGYDNGPAWIARPGRAVRRRMPLLDEQHLAVGRERPQLVRNQQLDLVARLSQIVHRGDD